MSRSLKILNWVVVVMVLAIVVVGGHILLRAQIEGEVYRDRLQAVLEDYHTLQETHEEAIKRTAVTELLVEKGRLHVVIRTAAGELERIPTPYDPRDEIHVDYVVLDGKLWIRRIHDSHTPAAEALVIDPKVADIEWSPEGSDYGISIYRPLGEGRWVVSVSGNGALTLTHSPADEDVVLSTPPRVRTFEEMDEEIQAEVDDISLWERARAVGRMLVSSAGAG